MAALSLREPKKSALDKAVQEFVTKVRIAYRNADSVFVLLGKKGDVSAYVVFTDPKGDKTRMPVFRDWVLDVEKGGEKK